MARVTGTVVVTFAIDAEVPDKVARILAEGAGRVRRDELLDWAFDQAVEAVEAEYANGELGVLEDHEVTDIQVHSS